MTNKHEKGPQRRRAIRFKPNPDTLAMIDPRSQTKEEFHPTVFALVHNESSTGCGLVALTVSNLMTGQNCRVQIGELAPVMAEIRWRADLDGDVMRLGLKYLSEDEI